MSDVDVRNDVVEVVKLENDAFEDDREKEIELFPVEDKLKSPPQDQMPVFNTNEVSMSTTRSGSPTDSRSSKSHDWVSPNKSSEMENEAFESRSIMSDRTATRENKSPINKFDSKDQMDEYTSDLDDANGPDFDDITQTSPSLSITANRLKALVFDDEFKPKAVVPPLDLSRVSGPALKVDASSKDWIKVAHGNKEKMMSLPDAGSFDMGTFEIAKILAATFNISDAVEIVGLTAGAIVTEDDGPTLKHHCDVVVPISFLMSGQLKRIVEASNDTIPIFYLVTKMLRTCPGYQGGVETEDVVSDEEVSYKDERLFSDAFIDVMENSHAFTQVEKNVLLRFGIGEANRGNILYRAAFRVAVLTGNPSYFEKGLKTIADVLLGNNYVKEVKTDFQCPPTKSIFSLIEFVDAADDLLADSVLTNEQYVAVVDALYSGHPEVDKLFDLHCCPDFLLACDSEDFRLALLKRDLLSLVETLSPVIAGPSDEQLKWAIHTGLHNFSVYLSGALPDEFKNIMHHMFSSGDEIVLSACKDFVLTNDSECVENMILREWNIYCHNRDRIFIPKEMKDFNSTTGEAPVLGVDTKDRTEVPDLLLTAVAALVDLEEMTEDAATAIVAAYMKGNIRLREIYEDFIEIGKTEDFLEQLKMASDDTQFVSSRALASPTPTKYEDVQALLDFDAAVSESKEYVHNVFIDALKSIKLGDHFGALEVSALRLAAVRKDLFLSSALRYYVDTKDDKTFFRDLKYVAEKIIHETDATSAVSS